MKGQWTYRQLPLIILIGLMVIAFPLCRILPIEWSWENRVIECSQVVIILAGAILTTTFAVKTRDFQNRIFFILFTLMLVVIALRELSWGAVFYQPVAMASHGPTFIPRKDLPYGSLIHPALGIYIIVWFVVAIRYKFFGVLFRLYKQGRFPVTECVLSLLAIILANSAEHQMIGEWVDYQVFEEYMETTFYIGFVLTVVRIKDRLTEVIH